MLDELSNQALTRYDDFSDLIETALNYSIGEMVKAKNIINPAAKNKDQMDEDQLTLTLSSPLKGMGFDISHSKNVGGNCDISVEGDSEMLWLGEAKIYSDYGKLMGGFQQLCDRYAPGMPNQTRGALLIYFFDGQVANVMQNWRKYVDEAREKLAANDVADNPLQFRTSEPHGATELMLNVLHMPVPLMHEPTDVAAPPKRNAA
ncbi:hypothetical protein [Sphingobium fuliginis]|uniref:hypothetical protein n=1 Tax=Sphingobium fuliginis (strain ATCC 27551) TaxID=336203 RepID=UPI000C081659|nr:hypothetical protein [Sphingobium fuliginis]